MYRDILLTDYFTEVYGDVETILDEENPRSAGKCLSVLLTRIDEITGEITGSYDCNTQKAKEKVLNEFGMFLDAVNWFDVTTENVGEWFINECWEYMDVLIRKYVFDYAIDTMLNMWIDKPNE